MQLFLEMKFSNNQFEAGITQTKYFDNIFYMERVKQTAV